MNPQDYIPTPCNENWDTMTGTDQRRFCELCSHNVHNLTGMDHDQIATLKAQLGGKLCGVFLQEPAQTKQAQPSSLKRPLIIGASISTLALAACQSTNTNTTNTPPPISHDKTPTKCDLPIPYPQVAGMICLPPKLTKE